MSHYGQLPQNLGHFPIACEEALLYLYLPISLAGSSIVKMPPNLQRFKPLITAVFRDESHRFFEENVYITAKHTYVSATAVANRPGWHSDGFLTSDLNYVFYDRDPTIFNISKFEVSPDHEQSLDQFWAQALPENDRKYPLNHLLKLDQYVIHRVPDVVQPGFRTFVKISLSPDQYNLSGNSRNYELDYDWPLHARSQVRNTPATSQLDAIR